MSVRYLTASELYEINVQILDGDTLVRDLNLLNSAARRPLLSFYGEPQFPTIIDKAAAMMESLAYHHVFMDGNKRTAIRAVALFLEYNGYHPTWAAGDAYAFALQVAQGHVELAAISDWIASHSQPAPPTP
jgi:death-on-curing protein